MMKRFERDDSVVARSQLLLEIVALDEAQGLLAVLLSQPGQHLRREIDACDLQLRKTLKNSVQFQTAPADPSRFS